MAILGGIGESTVADAQKDVQTDLTDVQKDIQTDAATLQAAVQVDIDKVAQSLSPVLQLATTINNTLQQLQTSLSQGKVVITVEFVKK